MRWMWIDRIVHLEPTKRIVAIKNISLAEDYLHDHFPRVEGVTGEQSKTAFPPRSFREPTPPMPMMPASLIIEGMAQTAGILVGHASAFKEKVILAKVVIAELDRDATPGHTLRYTAELERRDDAGASTLGVVDLIDPATPGVEAMRIGRIDLLFSHLDNNLAGVEFPKENFVFGESFKMLLRMSGVEFGG